MSTTPTFDPMDLHTRNLARLGPRSVVVAGYPGSGAALVGNILTEAGIGYLDPYTEVLHTDRQVTAAPERLDYRSRLAAAHRLDRASGREVDCGQPQFVKTHLYPEAFAGLRPAGVVLLVRDPRDAVHSYYRWRLGFSENGEHGSFTEFLRRPARSGLVPPLDWAHFNLSWAEHGLDARMLRFEELKTDPIAVMRRLLADFGVDPEPAVLARAVERSSFEAMRRHEDDVADSGARIMRSGLVGEWRTWYEGELAACFADERVRRAGARFGYVI
ncbi:sulfotransferase domain-containing protein [Kitasatospora sp. NPDC058063]|uniref:sulfotransferase domain-containing protein n=1 Tax=unclassified Kitasatospora TaxID=2633591 RepID=UPI0036D77DD6